MTLTSTHPPENLEELYADHSVLWGVFVQNAPAFLTKNINPSKGLSNGTAVRMVSLSFAPHAGSASGGREYRDKLSMLQQTINSARPGQIIDSQLAPISINCLVVEANHSTWPQNETLEADRVVIPVIIAKSIDKEQVTVSPQYMQQQAHVGTQSSTFAASKLESDDLEVYDFAVTLGFAITFQKFQGKTMPKIILDVSKRPYPPHVSWWVVCGFNKDTQLEKSSHRPSSNW